MNTENDRSSNVAAGVFMVAVLVAAAGAFVLVIASTPPGQLISGVAAGGIVALTVAGAVVWIGMVVFAVGAGVWDAVRRTRKADDSDRASG